MANYQQWSQTYFTNLTLDQHIANNNWLMNMLTMLKDDGVLYVPVLDKNFNRLGEEDYGIVGDLFTTVPAFTPSYTSKKLPHFLFIILIFF